MRMRTTSNLVTFSTTISGNATREPEHSRQLRNASMGIGEILLMGHSETVGSAQLTVIMPARIKEATEKYHNTTPIAAMRKGARYSPAAILNARW